MAKTPRVDVEATTVVRTDSGAVVNAPPTDLSIGAPAPAGSKLTFSMFCAARGIPVQRQAGMRAFTTTNEATLAEWVAIFKRY